jgi:MazG family protein
MTEFSKLLELADILLGPNGCMWDKKQTFVSLQSFIIEEAHELIEAIDEDNNEKIIEEAGDLFYAIIFLAKLAEIDNKFNLDDIIKEIQVKLIRRHPHVFSDVKVTTEEDIIKQWDKIKKKEKGKEKRDYDRIPPSLPILRRIQKILHLAKKENSPVFNKSEEKITEKEFADQLMTLIMKAESSNIDAESALRRKIQQIENILRKE